MINLDERSYTSFAAIERLSLSISAFSRGDEQEIDRLRRSCPIVEYKSMEREYIQSLEDLSHVIGLFCLICESYSNKILLVRAGLNAYIATYNCVDQHTFHSKSLDDQVGAIQEMIIAEEIIKDSKEKINFYIAYIKSAYSALEKFCNAVGISYEQIAKWIDIPSVNDVPIGQDKTLIGQVSVDEVDILELKKIMLSHWRGNVIS